MDDNIKQSLKNIESSLEYLRSIENLNERTVQALEAIRQSNERTEKLLEQILQLYNDAVQARAK